MTNRDKIIFYGLIPIFAAAIGAVIAGLIQAQNCSVPNTLQLSEIIRASNLTGKEKFEALRIYSDITDRPWSFVRSIFFALIPIVGVLVYTISDRIRDRPYK